MVKRAQTIDGFVSRPVRRRDNTINELENKTIEKRRDGFYPADSQVASVSSETDMKSETTAQTPEDELMNDIEDALSEMDDLAPAVGNQMGNNGATTRKTKKENKKRMKNKKPLSKKKIIKRIIIALMLIVLGVVGYIGVKAYLAGDKVFKGNPLAVLTTKTKLDEDENGRTNILIFGTSGYEMSEDAWDGAMLTDSIMVVSIDQDENNAYMMSLPRDLYVKHTCPTLGTTSGKLNETFYCAYSVNDNEEEGAKALMEQAGEILGLDIQYYAHADWTALVQAVDAVGGVDVTIESDDSRGIYDSSTGIKYANGEVAHLDGEKALALARARNHNYGDYGLSGGNYDREKNQQKILAALQQKALSLGTILNVSTVTGLIDALGNNLITDFDAAHVQTLIDIANNISADQIKQLPFVDRTDGGANLIGSYSPNGSYLGEAPVAGAFDYSEIQAYVKKNLTSDPVVQEGATVDVLNGSDVYGLAGEKAEELEEADYTIGEISNAPENISESVVIYQLTDGNSGTAAALKKKYGVEIKSGTLDGYETDADFVIIFGEEDS